MAAVLIGVLSLGLLNPSATQFQLGRRQLSQLSASAVIALTLPFEPALAAPKGRVVYSKQEAEDAIARMKVARIALDAVRTELVAKRFDEALSLIKGPAIGGFETDATILLQSAYLSAEDKIAIGTIRRYGVGADVIIMIGGMATAAESEDERLALDLNTKAKAALDEVLAIAKASK